MTDRPNTPVPDELFAVRAQLKQLETREAELRQLLLANPDLRTGAAYLAEIKEIATNRVDIKELRAMHKDLIEEYTYPQKTVRIELSAITEDGELISVRRKSA
jgi:hypothetical protein